MIEQVQRDGPGLPARLVLSRVVAAVDDNPLTLRAVGEMLTWGGYRTLLFDHPGDALEGLSATALDALILDRDMPLHTGPQLASILRRRWGSASPPIVLLTGNSHGLSRAERELFDLVLPKPITPRALNDAIAGLAAGRDPSLVDPPAARIADG